MKNKWVKIGEVQKPARLLFRGLYSQYAVMEKICEDGMRKYKEVHICTGTRIEISAQPENKD